jgi:hypothetical protein
MRRTVASITNFDDWFGHFGVCLNHVMRFPYRSGRTLGCLEIVSSNDETLIVAFLFSVAAKIGY